MLTKPRYWLVVLFIIILTAVPALAQTGALDYGDTVEGVVDEKSPQVFYTFNGETGDLMTAFVIGTSPGIRPTLILLGGTAGQLAFSDDDMFNPVKNDARITYRLPRNGAYTLIVSSQPDTSGTYFLSLQRLEAPSAAELTLGQLTEADFAPGDGPKAFSIMAEGGPMMTLALRPEPLDFAFAARVMDGSGQTIAVLGSPVVGAAFVLPLNDSEYELWIEALDPASAGKITIDFGLRQAGDTGQPFATPASGGPGAGTDGCFVRTGRSVVTIHSQPSRTAQVKGTMPFNSVANALGISNDWYLIEFNGQEGWVEHIPVLVRLEGACQDLGSVEP